VKVGNSDGCLFDNKGTLLMLSQQSECLWKSVSLILYILEVDAVYIYIYIYICIVLNDRIM